MSNKSRRRFLGTLATLVPLGAVAYLFPNSVLGAPPAEAAPPADPLAGLDPNSPEFAVKALERVDDMYRGKSSHGLMEMEVKTKHWTRQIAMENWSLGEDYSLVKIVYPKKEAGTATLKSKDDLYTYLSKTGRTIKITGGMMGGSWMGSHFTNDDLVQGARLSDDFVITRETSMESADTYVFRLVPKPDAAVVWGRIDATIRRSDLQPVQQLFYDEDGELSRKMTYSDIKTISGKTIPTRIRMEPTDKPGEYTEMRQKKVEFDVAIDKSFFTLQKLRSL
jgi:hypothetical protein